MTVAVPSTETRLPPPSPPPPPPPPPGPVSRPIGPTLPARPAHRFVEADPGHLGRAARPSDKMAPAADDGGPDRQLWAVTARAALVISAWQPRQPGGTVDYSRSGPVPLRSGTSTCNASCSSSKLPDFCRPGDNALIKFTKVLLWKTVVTDCRRSGLEPSD